MNITMEQTDNYLSLYDYLGHAAGVELGERVYKAATRKDIKMMSREISNAKYTGKVTLYPEMFLREYFGDDRRY